MTSSNKIQFIYGIAAVEYGKKTQICNVEIKNFTKELS